MANIMTEKFSRHVNEQHRWTEDLIARLRTIYSDAAHFKMTQDQFLALRSEILGREKRLTRDRRAYVDGYMRALSEAQGRALIHCIRIVGRPDTATSAKWNDMPEETRQAYRDHNTESCLAWDADGTHPFGPWSKG